MKALSIIQPWAWLIVAGHKDVENRDWENCVHLAVARRLIGQRIVIHASKKRDREEYELANVLQLEIARTGIPKDQLRFGAAIGTAKLVDVIDDEYPSPWAFGPIGLVLADPIEWPCAVPYKGALGFWEFPDELIPAVVAGGVRT